MTDIVSTLTPVSRLSRDLRKAGALLGDNEVRYLVDAYYQWQDNRLRAANQLRSNVEEPNAVLAWALDQAETLEKQIKSALDTYSTYHPLGEWMRGVKGIGPVIAAGLLAHLSGPPPQTVGHWWAFAGYDPTKKWEKGEKRPWNARLKVVCWKAGESFVKVSGNEDALYGQLYKARKEREIAKNEAGDFAEQAAHILETKKIGKTTDAYKWYSGKMSGNQVVNWQVMAINKNDKTLYHHIDTDTQNKEERDNELSAHMLTIYRTFDRNQWRVIHKRIDDDLKGFGQLPPAHLHSRAKRYAVKIFLAHFHEQAYRAHYGAEPPLPWPIAHLDNHIHKIEASGAITTIRKPQKR